MAIKNFETRANLKEKLRKRGLLFDDNELDEALIKYNYFNLFNGFESLLLSSSNPKKFDKVNLKDFIALYEFDKLFTSALFRHLNNIEEKLKSSISHHFSAKYCNSLNDTMQYTNKDNYMNPQEKNINHINTSQLRDMQGYVTQETWIFNNTIGKNIEIAKIGSTAEEIKEAARKAGIAEFIEKLPKGYDTTVGELGDSLSGGERQRIGIARAFLQNSEMILLDEPTSNLDSLNENYILKSLNMESGRKTIVLVSHRESTMAIADRVHKIQGGRLS